MKYFLCSALLFRRIVMFFAFFIIVIAAVAAFFKSSVGKGIVGEIIIKALIGKQSEETGKEQFVIHNFLLQLDNGKTSQTDHVLINSEGVFVIETKNYSGRIYGDDFQKEWTQVLNYGKVKNRFYSPIKQNYTHLCRIKNLLPDNVPIFSVVVFVKGNISYIKSDSVYTPWSFSKRIKSRRNRTLSLDEMKKIYNILTDHNKSKIISNHEHVQNIRHTQEEIENNICPRCQGTLVVRHGKNGDFIGCSNYPNCRFTKK